MIICKVKGSVVCSAKHPTFKGHKIMILQTLTPDLKEKGETFMAIDAVGVGVGEIVLCARHGSSARAIWGNVPFNAAIVGVIDTVNIEKK
ncbi:MAG TPA: EutN/CcmL family microcompartment protein [bacterium]|nr:EutN/CcmL family microcompartment protein [bacterium]HOL48545.1 EutN/CcmL family microcompartment protein [bacterium]HPQ19246.1 EutN/CcmL family microcompartment protein [bacterium]